jgi:hypothetical protein
MSDDGFAREAHDLAGSHPTEHLTTALFTVGVDLAPDLADAEVRAHFQWPCNIHEATLYVRDMI